MSKLHYVAVYVNENGFIDILIWTQPRYRTAIVNHERVNEFVCFFIESVDGNSNSMIRDVGTEWLVMFRLQEVCPTVVSSSSVKRCKESVFYEGNDVSIYLNVYFHRCLFDSFAESPDIIPNSLQSFFDTTCISK